MNDEQVAEYKEVFMLFDKGTFNNIMEKFISTNMIIPQVLRTILIPSHKDRIEMEQMDVGYTFPIFFDLKNCLGSLLDPQASLKNG